MLEGPDTLATMSSEVEVVRRAARFDLVIERHGDNEYRVVHQGQVVHTSRSRTIADAYFELTRDELQATVGQDLKSRIQAEQAFRDILGARGEATRRRVDKESEKGGKGGRGGT